MDMIVILLGLVILLVLTLKKVPVVFAALVSVVFIAAFSNVPVVATVTGDYMAGFANFIKSSWLMLMLGAVLSKLMDVTGAARAIATFIINKLGVKRAIPAIVIAGGLLTYGGVSAMVACFALYPITLAIFRKADLPRYLIPAAIGSGIFTWVTMLPGNPSVSNVIPNTYLGTTPMAAPVVGIVSGGVTLVLILLYLNYEVQKAKRKGISFEADEETNRVLAKADEMESKGSLPHPLAAVLPIICIAIVLNAFNMDISVALLAGILLCAVLFYKNITGVSQMVSDSISSAAVTAINASAIVGIGGVIKVVPGFQKIVDFVLDFWHCYHAFMRPERIRDGGAVHDPVCIG